MGYKCCSPGVKPLLNQEQLQKSLTRPKEKNNCPVAQWSKVFFSDERNFCIFLGNQPPIWRRNGDVQNPSCLKSRHEVSTFWLLCHLLLLVHKFRVPSRTFTVAHSAKTTSNWFAAYCACLASQLTCSEPHPHRESMR